MTPHRASRLGARLAAGLLLCLGGCAFGEDDAAVANTCEVDTDCGSGSECLDGVCIMMGSTELTYSLIVTPTHMPDGSPPIPMSLGPFLLDGRTRTFDLPVPITVEGSVFRTDGGTVVPMAASLHFTPVQTTEGLTPSTTAASTTEVSDLSAQLLDGVEYRVLVEPTDTTQPPYTFMFTAAPGKRLEVDYSKVKWTAQKFRVEGIPSGIELAVRAVDRDTGKPISSTAQIEDGPVVLRFPPEYGRYRLQLSARESYVQTEKSAPADDGDGPSGDCDFRTAAFPVLSVDDDVLRQDEARVNVLTLPTIPQPIVYFGRVELCAGASVANLSGMPMALEAQTLSLGSAEDDDGDAVEASYSASTTVTQDAASGALRFCARVLPGEYVVVVTPPANIECEIFAQARVIADGAAEDTLTLRTSALLSGTIETASRQPLAQGAIDARALGVNLQLPDGDLTVPSYNRSGSTTSNAAGKFRMPMDLGSYDIVIKPPMESGFAWQVLYDVDIDTRSRNFVTRVTLDTPVRVRGTLRYPGASRDAQRTLAGAEVHAFTQMPSGKRSVEIGRGFADEDGMVSLLIAPTLSKGL